MKIITQIVIALSKVESFGNASFNGSFGKLRHVIELNLTGGHSISFLFRTISFFFFFIAKIKTELQ